MGLFDKPKQAANSSANDADKQPSNKTVQVSFSKLPDSLDEFKALTQAQLVDPFDTAALTVLAMCFYPQNSELSLQMLGYLKGPQPLSAYDKQFIADRLR